MPTKKPDDTKPFEELYGKPLTPEEVKQMKHSLVNYVQTLIQMDRQHKALLAKRKAAKNDKNNSGGNTPTEVIH